MLEGVDLQHATRLLVRLNERDVVDGTYCMPFYGYNLYDGYFLASIDETQLCVDALKQAITSGTVSVMDKGYSEQRIAMEAGLDLDKGLGFYFKKENIVVAINQKNIELNLSLSFPACLLDHPITISLVQNKIEQSKNSPKTANHQARFIKTMLRFMYGSEDLANHPRRYFDNPDSEISTDFKNSGLKLPSGKTVENWIKDADIDYLIKQE